MLFMTSVTKRSGPPTAPRGHGATELTLLMDEIWAMDVALGRRRALTGSAKDLAILRLERLRGRLIAALHAPSKERLAASHAHVKGVDRERMGDGVHARGDLWLFEAQHAAGELLELRLDLPDAQQLVRKLLVLDGNLAERAAREGEGDARGGPAGGQLLADAVEVEDVPAVELDARGSGEGVHVADGA